MSLVACIDHLVIAAQTLDDGVQWCEETLGVTPGPGGKHASMGTHNRLLRIATGSYPNAYLEIIAIDATAKQPARRRWFDLDDPALRQQVRRQPQLVHFVARTTDAAAALQALRRLGIDCGSLVAAERATPDGLLRWQISIRRDGQRLFRGGLPTLIQWAQVHPVDAMAESGLALQSLRVSHPRAADLRAAYTAIGLQGVAVDEGAPNLAATVLTPKGAVTLESAGT